MNKALRRMSIACLAMFVVLLGWVNYLQVFRVNSLASETGNRRIFDQQQKNQRGEIIAAGGTGPQKVVAESKAIKGGFFQRVYPDPFTYAPVTGYDSILGTTSPGGITGIELAENKFLDGTAPSLAVFNLKGLFTGKSRQGASVYLTISPKAQAAAYAALAALGKVAGVVAINPRTGAILALASYPTFDPNKYATENSGTLAKIDKAYRDNPNEPLLNRAINDTFPPGSTFKLVTSSAAFETHKVNNPNSTIPAPTVYPLPGSSAAIHNDDNGPCADGKPSILIALTLSCNTAFAELGDHVGGENLHTYANNYNFNDTNLTIPLPVSPSQYPLLTDRAQIAQSAIGQFDDKVTPLEEAMIAATVANHGVMMAPYLVQEVRAPDQEVVQKAVPTEIRQVVTSQVASYLTTMMESVTHNPNGTAYATAGPTATPFNIAGKTGTAQNGAEAIGIDDAVFTCFAPADNPQIAVGVIVKGGGFGAASAAPIAVKVIEAFLGHQ
jgi:penicillin-binding protein A